MLFYFFFFKQKTAYEMRISDWSSDVCSSDLADLPGNAHHARQRLYDHVVGGLGAVGPGLTETADRRPNQLRTAGRDLLNIKADPARDAGPEVLQDRKSTRLNSSH